MTTELPKVPIESTRRISSDTVCVRIPCSANFAPGQFVTVGAFIQAAGKEVRRSYSICSRPNGEWIEITIKAQEPGLLSQEAQTWRGGEMVSVQGPHGHFIFGEVDSENPPVCIAGGSGIAPFRSLLQQLASAKTTCPLELIYSVKTSSDILYADELSELCSKIGARFICTISRPTPEDLANWRGSFGRVSGKLLHDVLGPQLSSRQYFVCGPTPMVQDVELLLTHHGVDRATIRTEKYGSIEG